LALGFWLLAQPKPLPGKPRELFCAAISKWQLTISQTRATPKRKHSAISIQQSAKPKSTPKESTQQLALAISQTKPIAKANSNQRSALGNQPNRNQPKTQEPYR
jgi:hypothetical protein